jgi:hypothetical protein
MVVGVERPLDPPDTQLVEVVERGAGAGVDDQRVVAVDEHVRVAAVGDCVEGGG